MGDPVTINLRHVARGLGIPIGQVQAAVELLDDGNTVPFITRYRKDQTGGLDEEQIRQIQARLDKQRILAERKQTILRSIESQNKLTEDLSKQIVSAGAMKRLEDLYLPYKPKKQTLATVARERGLEILATEILQAEASCLDLDARAADFVNPDRQIHCPADALLGAGHIIAEWFSEKVELRQKLREVLHRTGKLSSARIGGDPKAAPAKSETADKKKEAEKQSKKDKQGKPEETQRTTQVAAADGSSGKSEENVPPSVDPVIETPVVGQREATESMADHSTSPPPVESPVSPLPAAAPSESPSSGSPPGDARSIEPSADDPSSSEPSEDDVPAVEPVSTEPASTEASNGPGQAPGDPGEAATPQAFDEAESDPDRGSGQGGGEEEEPEPAAGPEPPAEPTPQGEAPSESVGQAESPAGPVSQSEAPSEPQAPAAPSGGGDPSPPADFPFPTAPSVPGHEPAATAELATEPEASSTDAGSTEPAVAPAEPSGQPIVDQTAEPSAEPPVVAQAKPDQPPQADKAAADKAPSERTAANRKRAKARKKQKKEQKRKRAEEKKQKAFSDYFDFSEETRKIPPHRVLAINRGERARVLGVKIECGMEAMQAALDEVCLGDEHPHAEFLRGCARDSLGRLILPSLERELRGELTERAEAHAVTVFAKNLRSLLLQPPVHGRRILALDPGFRSGCKLVALDQFGNVLGHDVIFLVGRAERKQEAVGIVTDLIERFKLTVVALGNGSACREAETFVSDLISGPLKDRDLSYVIANEAGADAYSTSPLGREEFPNYDATLRGAISIGRRLLDPLSELVKIDPANVGVGLYQHDVKAKHLRLSLDSVIESCVNYVGVDVNTASPALLRYVSGLNQLTARRVVEHRLQNGPFRNREQLREVPGLGETTFVQAAGFLKIRQSDNPLDATWIHPESYQVAEGVMAKLGCSPEKLAAKARGELETTSQTTDKDSGKLDVETLATELAVGLLSLKDILAQLARPGRDPREELPPPIFKQGVLSLADLKPGMELTGAVLNVVDFGAFVDIGMPDSGLVHVSQLADRFVRDPHEVIAVGQIVKVWVVEADQKRRRVSLTMVRPGSERQRAERPKPADGAKPAQRGSSSRQGGGGQGGSGGQGRPSGQGRPGGKGRSDRPRSGGKSFGRGGPRSGGRAATTYKPKSRPKPVVPITKKMKSGKEPMRTFGDLAQFFGAVEAPAKPESSKKSKKKKKPAPDAEKKETVEQQQAPEELTAQTKPPVAPEAPLPVPAPAAMPQQPSSDTERPPAQPAESETAPPEAGSPSSDANEAPQTTGDDTPTDPCA